MCAKTQAEPILASGGLVPNALNVPRHQAIYVLDYLSTEVPRLHNAPLGLGLDSRCIVHWRVELL